MESRFGKLARTMKRALQTATLLLIAASFLLHWRLAAEAAALRQDTSVLQ